MTMIVDIDKYNSDRISRLPTFIGLRAISRTKVELLFTEDADYIASLFVNPVFEGSEYKTPDYWRSYNEKCEAKLSPEKTLKILSGRKRKRGYWHKYDLAKMFLCTKAKCPNPKHVCRRIEHNLIVGHFVCKCREPA